MFLGKRNKLFFPLTPVIFEIVVNFSREYVFEKQYRGCVPTVCVRAHLWVFVRLRA